MTTNLTVIGKPEMSLYNEDDRDLISDETLIATKRLYCPYCKNVFDREDSIGLVTLHGSSEKDVHCTYCKEVFGVIEIVDRTYTLIREKR